MPTWSGQVAEGASPAGAVAPITEGEAVCFTAGASGLPFGAGVIHAWLALNRPPPKVAAGISAGSINAAAFWATWHEPQEGASHESQAVRRRARFRDYLSMLADAPLHVLWNAIPDTGDFFTDAGPVRDPEVPERLRPLETEGLHRRQLLLELWRWFGYLPVPLRRVARLVQAWIALKELRPSTDRAAEPTEPPTLGARFSRARSRLVRAGRAMASVAAQVSVLIARLAWHVLRQPRWVRAPSAGSGSAPRLPRPLLGWPAYLFVACLVLVLPLVACLITSVVMGLPAWCSIGAAVATVLLIVVGLVAGLRAAHGLLSSVGMKRGLLSEFHLRLALSRLLAPHQEAGDAAAGGPLITRNALPYPLIVASPLQQVVKAEAGKAPRAVPAIQAWARPGVPLEDALVSALALSPILAPQPATGGVARWLPDGMALKCGGDRLDLVDGAAIRQNPIPALFEFLAETREVRLSPSRTARAIHVVHSVPVQARDGDGRLPEDRSGIVQIGAKSLGLSHRLDTNLEVDQTNFLSDVQALIKDREGEAQSRLVVAYADEIAPSRDLAYRNWLDPTRDEVLAGVAHGCRQTMARLNQGSQALGTCPRRFPDAAAGAGVGPDQCGLPEVCQACTEPLTAPRERARIEYQPPTTVDAWAPRLVFVASGGVFRGAFHIGMAGALLAARLRPHLVVGSSVGTIMGAALARLTSGLDGSTADDVTRRQLLGRLVTLFEEVDRRVAFTRRFMGATRQLGARLTALHLSPAAVTRKFRAGIRADPGFAAQGAPPALIDALSTALFLPIGEAADIARRFVSDDVAGATWTLARALETRTLVALGIQDAIMGASLLEHEIRELLGPLDHCLLQGDPQPFAGPGGVELFATTTQLASEVPVLLGQGPRNPSRPYDLVSACLASAAFPAVFRPRRESEIFPGTGRTDVRFGDGGLFDNLPFLPALGLLARRQRALRERAHATPAPLDFLAQRRDRPHLFIAGALNVNPEEGEDLQPGHADLFEIGARAGALAENVKVRAFELSSELVARQIDDLVATRGRRQPLSPEQGRLVDGIVNAAVLAVFPASREHLNGTFAFCRALGLQEGRVHASIANGCYQTLHGLGPGAGRNALASRALEGLGVVPLTKLADSAARRAGACWHFARVEGALECPFAGQGGSRGSASVHAACRDHLRALGRGARQ